LHQCGVIVQVSGNRPRAVPVLARYHDPLLESARFAGDGLVTGGTSPQRHNITNPLARSLAGGSGLPRLDTSRLRATWLAEVAQLTGLATFLHAGGITCSQRLGDIIATLDRAAKPRRWHCSADYARMAGSGEHPARRARGHHRSPHAAVHPRSDAFCNWSDRAPG
jgi:hypothetical protein